MKFPQLLDSDQCMMLLSEDVWDNEKAMTITKVMSKSVVIQHRFIYIYNSTSTLFEKQPLQDGIVIQCIMSFVQQSFQKAKDDNANWFVRILEDKSLAKQYQNLRQTGKSVYRRDMVALYNTMLKNDDIIFDRDIDGIHFRNGRYILESGELVARTSDHFITKCIDLDYTVSDVESITYIQSLLDQVFREPEAKAHMVYQLGCCLSGRSIRDQKFLFNFGTGGAGKTFTIDLLEACMGQVYVQHLPSSTFLRNNSKVDKILNSITPNTRFLVVEELPCNNLDVDLMKQVADGHVSTTKLYQDGCFNIEICGKLFFLSNHMMSFHPDTGINRRLLAYEYKNRFVDEDEIDKVNNTTVFKKRCGLAGQLTDAQRIAVFNIIATECKRFYNKENVPVPQCFVDATNETIQQNDEWQDFIDAKLVAKEGNRIPKLCMEQAVHDFFGNKKRSITTKQIIIALRERNVSYNKDTRSKSTNVRGCFLHYQLKLDNPVFISGHCDLDDGVMDAKDERIVKLEKQLSDRDAEIAKLNELLAQLNSTGMSDDNSSDESTTSDSKQKTKTKSNSKKSKKKKDKDGKKVIKVKEPSVKHIEEYNTVDVNMVLTFD